MKADDVAIIIFGVAFIIAFLVAFSAIMNRQPKEPVVELRNDDTAGDEEPL